MKEVLRLEGVCTQEKGGGLFNINFALFQGETLGIFIRDQYYSRALVRLLRGISQPARGQIYVDDSPVLFDFDSAWRQHGVCAVWGESRMIPNLSIAENLYLISPVNKRSGLFSRRALERKAKKLLARYQLDGMFTPDMPPLYMTSPQCQLLDILKCVGHGARVLVIDNIFHRYSEQDFDRFFDLIRLVKRDGLSVIILFNSWNPRMVSELSRVSVMRNGTVTAQVGREEFDMPGIMTLLSGDEPPPDRQPAPPDSSRAVLQVQSLACGEDDPGLSFTLAEGEVLGLFDAGGYSGEKYVKALCGQAPCRGHIVLGEDGYDMNQTLFSGGRQIGLIPMNDCHSMVIGKMSLLDNVTLMIPDRFCGPFTLLNNRIRRYMYQDALRAVHAEAYIPTPDATGKSVRDPEMQVRLLCAKFICRGVRLLLLTNPQYIYDDVNIQQLQLLLDDLRNAGMAVVIVSTSAHLMEKTCSRTLRLGI